MSISKKPSEDDLVYIRDYFDYDPGQGVLYRRCREDLEDWRICSSYDRDGYLVIGVNYKRMMGHNICWYLYHGRWPELIVHHIDENPGNNCIKNLCLATHGQNNSAKDCRSHNRFHGVYRNTTSKSERYYYHVKIDGITQHKGGFYTELDAAKARERFLDSIGNKFAKRNPIT